MDQITRKIRLKIEKTQKKSSFSAGILQKSTFSHENVRKMSSEDFVQKKCKACLTWSLNSAILHVKEALHQIAKYAKGAYMKNRIVQIRQERGIRQDELAKALGVSRQTISSLENGRYDPSILLAHKIAKLFGMSIEEVFLFEEEEK